MAVPPHTSPSPKQSQLYYQPGTGLTTRPVSVPRKEIQKSRGAAGTSSALVASGTGTATIASANLLGLQTYTFQVPLSIPVPMTAASALSLNVGAPVISGTWTMVVRSTTANPLMLLSGSATPVSAQSIAQGQTVRQFLVSVTINWRGTPPANTNLVVTCNGSLVTV